MLPELVARCRALPEESPPLLILVDRRDPMVVRFREECLRVLVTQELDRLRNLRQTADRERFVLGRGLVRLLLGGWLALLESLSVQMGRNLMLAIPAT
jgi:hypothetical protein